MRHISALTMIPLHALYEIQLQIMIEKIQDSPVINR